MIKLYRFYLDVEWVGGTDLCVCAESEEAARKSCDAYMEDQGAEGRGAVWPQDYTELEVLEPGEVAEI